MIALENPPGFIVRTEAQVAAGNNGFRREQGQYEAWFRYSARLVLTAWDLMQRGELTAR